jgi:hypothetical protein
MKNAAVGNADATPENGRFALNPEVPWDVFVTDVAAMHLRGVRRGFADPRVEEEFLRFHVAGRRMPLVLVCLLLAGFYVFAQTLSARFAAAGVGRALSLSAAIVLLLCAAALLLLYGVQQRTFRAKCSVAWRHEVIMLVAVTVPGCLQAYADRMFQRASCASEGIRCGHDVPLVLAAHIVLVSYSHVRSSFAPFIYLAIVTSYVVGTVAAVGLQYQTLVSACVAASIAVALGIESAGTEREERKHFVSLVLTRNSNEYLKAAGGALRALIEAVVPPELVDRTVAMETVDLIAFEHASDDATVSIAAIHDFAQWSTGLLPLDVVGVLHVVVVSFTQEATKIGVSTAMTYGDSYVACAGLLAPCAGHRDAMTAFGRWQMAAAAALNARDGYNVQLKVSVCSGELKGGVAGSVSLRFIIAGAAFDEARVLLETCPANEMVCGASLHGDVESRRSRSLDVVPPPEFQHAGTTGTDEVSPAEPTVSGGHEADSEPGGGAGGADAADVIVGPPNAAGEMSSCTLRFADPDVEAEMAEFAEYDEHTAGWHSSIVLPITFLAVLLGVITERSVEQNFRGTDAAPLALVFVAVVVAGMRSANQYAAWRVAVPVAVEYVGVVLCLLAVATAMVLLRGTTVTASPFFFTMAVGCPNIFRRLPWFASVLLQWLPVSAPAFVFASAAFGGDVAYVVLVSLAALLIRVVVRYGANRGTRLHFAAEYTALLFAALQHKRQLVQHEFVAALVPPHIVPELAGVVARPADDAATAPTYWIDLTALQLRLNSGGWSFDELVRVGAVVGSAVAEVGGGRLELVQSMGDAFLVAGPFDDVRDDRAGAASQPRGQRDVLVNTTAHLAIDTVREIARQLGASMQHFTAVLTAGSAFSALLGASLSTFRLFGPCVRESNAILSGAPTAPAACAVYASESFRRLHESDLLLSPRPRRSADGGLSGTIGPGESSSGDTVAIGHVVGGEAFSAPLKWRVRGSGVAMISVVKI